MKNNDFPRFVKEDSDSAPSHLSAAILTHVKQEIEPEHKSIFFKLISIQAFVGIVSLIFCPQFELSLTNNYELFHFFHYKFGEQICMMICGAIFLGSGALAASFLLNRFELKRIGESNFLYSFTIGFIALSVLFVLGTPVYNSLLLFWFSGAIGSNLIIFFTTKKIVLSYR